MKKIMKDCIQIMAKDTVSQFGNKLERIGILNPRVSIMIACDIAESEKTDIEGELLVVSQMRPDSFIDVMETFMETLLDEDEYKDRLKNFIPNQSH